MEIPQKVLNAAKGFIKIFGNKLSLLGTEGDKEYYIFDFPKGELNGIPHVFIYQGGKRVVELSDNAALDAIALFRVK